MQCRGSPPLSHARSRCSANGLQRPKHIRVVPHGACRPYQQASVAGDGPSSSTASIHALTQVPAWLASTMLASALTLGTMVAGAPAEAASTPYQDSKTVTLGVTQDGYALSWFCAPCPRPTHISQSV